MKPMDRILLAVVVGTALPTLAHAQSGPGEGSCMQQHDRPCMQMMNDDDGTGTRMYGYPLMTPDEIAAHRARMQAATPQQRARIRAEHHKLMVERARARGVQLPEQRPMHGGKGAGPGKAKDKKRAGSGN